jgi:hypothetical protein
MVRFGPKVFASGIREHVVEKVAIRILLAGEDGR